MIQERIWIILGVMMLLPMIIIMLVPEPYSTIGVIASNLFMLFYLRRFYRGITKGIFGSKTLLVCTVCNGNKFDASGTCKRCGSKNRRLG